MNKGENLSDWVYYGKKGVSSTRSDTQEDTAQFPELASTGSAILEGKVL